MLCYCLLFHIKATSNPYSYLTTNLITGTSNETNLPKLKYVLRSCKDCTKYKKYTVEYDETIYSSIIKFHIYEVFTIFPKYGAVEPGNLL